MNLLHPARLAPLLLVPLALAAPLGRGTASAFPTRPAQDEPAKPATFDATTEAPAAFERELHVAAHKNRRVLVVWGANGEASSEALATGLRSRDLGRFLLYEFRTLRLDAGEDSPGRALAARLGVDLSSGLPHVSVHDAEGKLLGGGAGSTWAKDAALDTAAFKVFLESHVCEPLDAEKVLAAELAAVTKADQRLIVHLGAPW